MNCFTNLQFYLPLGVVLSITTTLHYFQINRTFRNIFLVICNFYFISLFISTKDMALITLLYMAFVLAVAYSINKLNELGSKYGSSLLTFTITCLVAILIFFNHQHIFENTFVSKFFIRFKDTHFTGLSYLTLRAIDLLLSFPNSNKRINVLVLINYLSFFPTFLAGPILQMSTSIENSQEFDKLNNFRHLLMMAKRLCIGIIKVLFISKWLFHNSVGNPSFDVKASLFHWLLSVYAYTFYVYFEFSGYCDCAIAIASALGIQIPENFNFPFLSKNLQEFWGRWHITLSRWARDYLFFSISAFMSRSFKNIPSLVNISVSVILTFLIMGLWHGSFLTWGIYGLVNGLGLLISIAYRKVFERVFPVFYSNLKTNFIYELITCFTTLTFISLSLLFTLTPRT